MSHKKQEDVVEWKWTFPHNGSSFKQLLLSQCPTIASSVSNVAWCEAYVLGVPWVAFDLSGALGEFTRCSECKDTFYTKQAA